MCSRVKAWVRDNKLVFPAEIKIPKERFFIEDDVLYLLTPGGDSRRERSVVRTVLPSSFVKMALQLVHSSPIAGHLGVAKTIRRAKENFYWHKMDRDVTNYVKGCTLCHKFKGHQIKVPPARQWPIRAEKFYRIHLDLIGPLPTSPCGKRFILVITDAFTRCVYSCN